MATCQENDEKIPFFSKINPVAGAEMDFQCKILSGFVPSRQPYYILILLGVGFRDLDPRKKRAASRCYAMSLIGVFRQRQLSIVNRNIGFSLTCPRREKIACTIPEGKLD